MSSSNKRQRELAKAKYERQQARRQTRHQHRRRNQRITAIIVVAALVLGSVAWIVVGSRSEGSPTAEASPAATTSSVVASCTGPTTTTTTPKTYTKAPAIDSTLPATTTITLVTNCGPIVIRTLPKLAPATVASEVFLAEQGYYDQTPCHRLTTEGIYVLQCGDPTGSGSGGPGYTVPDENLPKADGVNYPAGTVAMANAGRGTAGSQFFIVYQDTTLPADYTIWGTVESGLDVVTSAAAAGVADGSTDGAPAQPVVIEQATVKRA